MRSLVAILSIGLFAGYAVGRDSRNSAFKNQDTHFELKTYASRAAWEARKLQLRRQILAAAGLIPLPVRSALNPRITERVDRDGYIMESLLIETLPGYYLGGTLYRPSKPGRYPGVLVPHGHWKHGRFEDLPTYSVPALGINLARQGYVAFAYDMVGYNDTKQTPHNFGGWREQLWSFSPLGLQLWNSMRAVDFLAGRRDVDPKRLAVTGASGGATQTFLLAAVDDRIGYSAPVNMVSAHMQGGDPCEEAPNLRLRGANNVEFAAMAAPKPMLVISCSRDWTKNTPIEEFPYLQRIYGLYGSEPHVSNVHLEAEHNYNKDSRAAVYRFFSWFVSRVPLPGGEYEEDDPPELKAVLQPASFVRNAPPGALDYDELFESWIAMARRQSGEMKDAESQRERMRLALGSEWPARVEGIHFGEEFFLTRPGIGDRVPALWIPGQGDPIVVVDAGGFTAARSKPAIKELADSGRPLLFIDAFQTGSARAPREQPGRWFLSYNQTVDANRVQDVLTALSFARSRTNGKPRLVGLGDGGIWCLFAAAVSPVSVELAADLEGFRGSDEDFRHRFFVPGIQRAGGLDTALRLARRSRAR